jgi:hypothetical protein
MKIYYILYLFLSVLFMVLNCGQEKELAVTLKTYTCDNLEGLISLTDVSIDSSIFSEGSASIKLTVSEPRVINLFETGDLDVENARLIYQAKMRTEGVVGEAFLEMWCHFPDQGEFFSRGLQTQLSGDNNWVSQETPFFLKKGENPDNVKINVVIKGSGTVWIDDIKLLKAPR